jgi:hypothetical protein
MTSSQSETPLDRLRSALSVNGKPNEPTLQEKIRREIYAPFHAQIKILEILPVDPKEPDVIRCTLRNREPWDKRPYTALSYVWGDPQVVTPIVVNGRQVPTTINLAEALCHLRGRPEHAKSLWIDALCIDQQNEQEKNQQVQMMDTIYREANTVVAWLGAADDASKRAMETMKKLSKIAIELGIQDLNQPAMHEIDLERGRELIAKAGMAVLGSAAFHKGDVGHVVDFLQKPYWNRLWIIQEVNLARDAIMVCGSDEISWGDAQASFAIMMWISSFHISINADAAARLFELQLPHGGTSWSQPPVVRMTSTALATGSPELGFINLFLYTCDDTHLGASNPNDRIYALLGFMMPSLRKAITVDYERDIVVLFTAITRYSLECHGAYTLMFCGLAYRSASQTDLPSWALDWTSTKPRSEDLLRIPRDKRIRASLRCRFIPIGTRRIAIRGVKVSQVLKVVGYSGASEDALEAVNELQRIAHPPGIDAFLLRILIVSILEGIAQEHPPVPCNIYITEQGHAGSGPRITQIGDVVHMFEGCEIPFLLRPASKDEPCEQWQLVGPTYVEEITSLGGNINAFCDSKPEFDDIFLC